MASKKISKYIFISLAVIICGVALYKILPLVYSSVEYNSSSPVVLGDKANNIKPADSIIAATTLLHCNELITRDNGFNRIPELTLNNPIDL